MRYYSKVYTTLIALMISLGFVAFICLSVWVSIALAKDKNDEAEATREVIVKETIIKESESICPRTKMKENCLICHTEDWRLKEVPWDAHFRYPYGGFKFYKDSSENLYGFYLMTAIYADALQNIFDYLDTHKVKKLVLEIQCTGGNVGEMWRTVGLMREWEIKGGIIETKLNGIAFSAAFLTFASGSKGHRFVNPTAELMWHEAQILEWWEIATPAGTEERAKIYRHLQDTCNEYLASLCNLTKKELDLKVRQKEFWINGKQAVEYGFADSFIGE